ncbi:MAG: tRNA pseudouridine(38-40) synthase TruA [Chloroflexi bacterium]|nr:tRNA pseudouridine(38-40) synthase TruA [Chloroflexota bacterium]
MARYRLTVEYDGTAYHGFQLQRGQPTIQGELEEALAKITGEAIRVAGAGRTDAGVHALGQVVSFDAELRLEPATLLRALNGTLPRDVAAKSIEEASPRFHARFSARSRSYRYRIFRGAVRSPLWWRYSLHEPRELRWDALTSATEALLGRHDFAAFSGAVPGGYSTTRTVISARWHEHDDLLDFEIEADAFLPHMVRLIVGALLRVGRGRLESTSILETLAQRDRAGAGPAVPSCGLYLLAVTY